MNVDAESREGGRYVIIDIQYERVVSRKLQPEHKTSVGVPARLSSLIPTYCLRVSNKGDAAIKFLSRLRAHNGRARMHKSVPSKA